MPRSTASFLKMTASSMFQPRVMTARMGVKPVMAGIWWCDKLICSSRLRTMGRWGEHMDMMCVGDHLLGSRRSWKPMVCRNCELK